MTILSTLDLCIAFLLMWAVITEAPLKGAQDRIGLPDTGITSERVFFRTFLAHKPLDVNIL